MFKIRFVKCHTDLLRYQFDLLMDSMSGHISMYDIGPVVGSVYINQLIGRLVHIFIVETLQEFAF